jgi:beta-galactosidase
MKSCCQAIIALTVLSAIMSGWALAQNAPISLAGSWSFSLDRDDKGVNEQWFSHDLGDNITLPGTLQAAGFGDDITGDTQWMSGSKWDRVPQYSGYRKAGDVKIPFWLQPAKYYVGVAWYEREIDIPAAWAGKRVVFTMERPHWETQVWIDGKALGADQSLFTPHVYDLGTELTPGKHRLAVRIDNRLVVNIGNDSHGIGDHTQGDWNGIVGRIDLTATSPVYIDSVQVYPQVASTSARVVVTIGNATNQAGSGTVKIGDQAIPAQWGASGTSTVEGTVNLGADAKLWDEFHPNLQHLTVTLSGPDADDQRTVTFGLREIVAKEGVIELNGHAIFLRGTHDGGQFPILGHPAMDINSWKRIFAICKSYGMNYVRFHSWCPPEAAFQAADEMGLYLRPELMWTQGKGVLKIEPWVNAETKCILDTYGNHPSFALMVCGNEFGSSSDVTDFLTQWVTTCKQDPRHIYAGAAGYPSTAASDFIEAKLRGGGGWGAHDYSQGYKSALQDVGGKPTPLLSHELGQWCAYPDFDEIAHYTGFFKAKNFEIFRDQLKANGMLDQAHDFLIASGKLQVLCDKEDIEGDLRTPGCAGFDLLDLHDFPGQGTALIGVLNSMWESKGYVTPEEFRRFCSPTVTLARITKPTWLTSEHFSADVEVTHFGDGPLVNAVPYWKLVDPSGKAVLEGKLPELNIPLASDTPLGKVEFDCATLAAPAQYRLVVGIEGTQAENDWNVWVDPPPTGDPADVTVASTLDDALLANIQSGAKVLLLPSITKDLPTSFPLGSWRPVFWNRQWFPDQATETLGLLIDAKHPALAEFPTDTYSGWDWQDIADNSRSMLLTSLPAGLKPIVQTIDDWNTNRRLAMIVEARVGNGSVVICTADLSNRLNSRPEARQLRASLLNYLAGPNCHPATELSADQLKMLATRRVMPMPPCTATADISTDKAPASNLVDGDTSTDWSTPDGDGKQTGFPHWVELEFMTPQKLTGIVPVPGQHGGVSGVIKDYSVQISDDGAQWKEVAKGTLPFSKAETRITFPAVETRFIRLEALTSSGGKPHVTLSELWLLNDDSVPDN